MIDESLTEEERQMLKRLVMEELAGTTTATQVRPLVNLLSKLNGTDTQIIARRVYPSQQKGCVT